MAGQGQGNPKDAWVLQDNDPVRLPVTVIPQQTVRAGVVSAAAGGGIVAILMTLLQGQPQLIAQIVNWGPGLVIFGGVGWLAQKFIPPMVATQDRMANNIGDLAGSIRASLSRDDDVRDNIRTLFDKMDRLHEGQREMMDTIREMKA